ncbi:MAG: hypothetical protein D6788_05530 [Planctomycetota bacterium]|nr:MAG: hypothetical protein D6788_05530 [Planctomycetota bacterium]
MDRLRALLRHIQDQLGGLTLSQRIAIGLCAALIAVSLLSLVQWSGKPTLVPLVNYRFSFDELTAVEDVLKANRIPYQIVGASRVLVREADRHNALRLVNQADALPEGSLFDLQAVVKESNPFQSPEARNRAWTYAKGNELAKIIATSPFVEKASVILNPVTKRRIGGVTDVPTASVAVTLVRGHEMTRQMVEAFAKLVAGAVAGLKPHNVYITDARTLRSYSLPNPEDAASFDLLSMIKQREAHYRRKILDKLADIPGVQVAVTVELDTSKRVTTHLKHDVPQPKSETSSTTEQRSAAQPAEPGVQANLGTALTAGGSGQTSTSEESTVENFEPQLTQQETIEQLPFATKKVSAAVGIPRSFIVGVYLTRHPDQKDAPAEDDPAFVAVRDEQIERVRKSVSRIVMAQNPDDVVVDVYPDMEWTPDGGVQPKPLGAAMAEAEAGTATGMMGLVRDYGPRAGLAFLALMSLFLMMRIAKQSSQAAAKATAPSVPAAEPESEEILTVGGGPIGQATPSESMLTGKEVDPETLRYQELGAEVAKMVEEDPDGAADLIRRWLEAQE